MARLTLAAHGKQQRLLDAPNRAIGDTLRRVDRQNIQPSSVAARLTGHGLRVAISELLPEYYKQYEIEQACTAFGMPEVENAWTYNSKRVYVSNRLARMSAISPATDRAFLREVMG